jgi:hypothetical protein
LLQAWRLNSYNYYGTYILNKWVAAKVKIKDQGDYDQTKEKVCNIYQQEIRKLMEV